jgi:alpha-1,3-rhamnosyltransferase
MTPPLVSIVIPAYNHEQYIEQAVRSVLEQTYPNIELVVVDDGSTDGTWDRIVALHAKEGGRFSIFTKPNAGPAATLNYAIARTRGAYIGGVASDDYFLPRKIEIQMDVMLRASPSVGLNHTSAFNDYGDGKLVDFTGNYVPAEGACFKSLLACESQIVAPSVLFRRSAYDAIGGFDETLGAEDFDFYVRLAAQGFSFEWIREPLVVKRETGRNLGGNIDNNHASRLAMLAKYHGKIPQDVYDYGRSGVMIVLGENELNRGNLRASFEAYRAASQIRGERRLMARWAARAARSTLLKTMPAGTRSLLREARSNVLRTVALRRRPGKPTS